MRRKMRVLDFLKTHAEDAQQAEYPDVYRFRFMGMRYRATLHNDAEANSLLNRIMKVFYTEKSKTDLDINGL